jgi:hypothetical protein
MRAVSGRSWDGGNRAAPARCPVQGESIVREQHLPLPPSPIGAVMS